MDYTQCQAHLNPHLFSLPILHAMDTLGARMRAAREAERLSQLVVAAELGITKGALSAWENDKYLPQLETFGRLCQLYRTSADALLFADNRVSESPRPEYSAASPKKRAALDKVLALTDAQCAGLVALLSE